MKTDTKGFRILVDAGIYDVMPLHHYDAMVPDKGGRLLQAGKRPLEDQWTKNVYDSAKVLAEAEKTGRNLGVRLKATQLVVDVDPRNFGPTAETKDLPKEQWVMHTLDTKDNPFQRLMADCGMVLEDFPHVVTGSGGLHIYLTKPANLSVKDTLKDLYPGIEYKSLGRQVVAPGSIHPDTKQHYVAVHDAFADFKAPPEINQKLSDLIGRSRTNQNRSERLRGASDGSGEDVRTTIDAGQIAKLLPWIAIPSGRGDYEDWIKLLMAANFASNADHDVFKELEAWCEPGANLQDRWQGFGQNDGLVVTFGTLARLALQYAKPEHKADVERWITETRAASDFADADDGTGEVADDPADPTGVKAASKGDRPVVKITGANREEVLEQTALHLFDALGKDKLFYRGTELVNVAKIGEAVMGVEKIEWTLDDKGRKCFDRNGVRSYPGSTYVSQLTGSAIRYHAGKIIQYQKKNGRAVKAGYQPVDAPLDLVDLVNLTELWPFQELTAVAAAPLIDFTTGDVLTMRGILPGTGVLALFDPKDFQGIRTDLTQEEAKAMLEGVYEALYPHFPFEGGPRGPSSAVNMTACFGALLRPVMDQGCPAHAFDAPQASSGKSKLSETHGIIATGAIPAMAAWSNDDKENEKRLGASLRRAPQVLVFDNLDAKNKDIIQFAHMNTAITATKVTVRILGKTEDVEMPCLTFIEFNGNNIQVSGDMATRIVKCRIDAKMANPETRVFDFDPVERARTMRGEIVVALLSVLASYIKAGKPMDNQLLPMRFGKAWRSIQGAVMWCGWDDPVKTVEEVMATDERRMIENEAAELWLEAFGEEPITAAELFRIFKDDNCHVGEGVDELDISPIYEVILTSTSRAQALAQSLKDGKVVGDYLVRVEKNEDGHKTARMVRPT